MATDRCDWRGFEGFIIFKLIFALMGGNVSLMSSPQPPSQAAQKPEHRQSRKKTWQTGWSVRAMVCET